MIVAEPRTQALNGTTQAGPHLERAVRDYARAHVRLYGQRKAAEDLGVSRHTLWRFVERGHAGRAVPSAVLSSVGGSVGAIKAATFEIIIDLEGLRPDPALRHLRRGLEEALLLLCATPLATVEELSRFGLVPTSTLRDRLKRLTERGLVDSVPPPPERPGFPPAAPVLPHGQGCDRRSHGHRGREAHAADLPGVEAVVPAARRASGRRGRAPPRRRHDRRRRPARQPGASGPLSQRSLRHADHPVRWRTIGLIRQGPALPTSRLRYRLRSTERLDSTETPFITLVLTHADQATRRAVRSLGDPSEHRRTFAATEGELLAGDHTGVVWQQCGSGLGEAVRIDPDASLAGILAWAERLLDSSYSFLRDRPKPKPGALYPSGVQATMPESVEQLTLAFSVQLTRAEKDALDLLSAWPLCTREQLAGLMGGVTLRRVNQVLRSLTQHGLVRTDEPLHMLTDEGADVSGPQGPGRRGADP